MSTFIFKPEEWYTKEELEELRKVGLHPGRTIITSGKSIRKTYSRPFYYPTVIKK